MGAFVTCSADGSIRVWCLDFNSNTCKDLSNVSTNELVGVFYNDKQAEVTARQSVTGSDEASDAMYGFRSIAISPEGQYLAAGDRGGNLRVYDVHTFKQLSFKEAHDAEILSLSFGYVSYANCKDTDNQDKEVLYLASGGRDRLVHIYSVERNFDVVETLDDHSASITCVKFTCNGSKLLSCSADKSVVFRNVEVTDVGLKSTRYHQEIASRGTIYDMDINPLHNSAVTVGQDKKVNFLSLATGKSIRCFKPEGESGEAIKARVDPSGTYVICSHSDKSMRIFDFASGELLAQASGHAEIITGATFLPDCRRLISVSGDSCIFIWRLPKIVSKTIRSKCVNQPGLKDVCVNFEQNHLDDKTPVSNTFSCDFVPHFSYKNSIYDRTPAYQNSTLNDVPPFKFSISRLPHWAQEKVTDAIVNIDDNEVEANSFKSSDSRWAERLGREGYKLFSENQQEETLPATIRASGFGIRRRFTVEPNTYQDSTPESSLESQRCASPASSQKDAESKETQWKIVHTVFFDDEIFLQDKDATDGNQLTEITEKKNVEIKHADHGKGVVKLHDLKNGTEDDGIVVYLSEDENRDQENCNTLKEASDDRFTTTLRSGNTRDQTSVSGMHTQTESKEMPLLSASSQCIRFEKWSEYVDKVHAGQKWNADTLKEKSNKLDVYRELKQNTIMTVTESSEDDEAIEEDFTPRRDLFTLHFDKLSTAFKGRISARSSFSTRYFARYSGSLPRMSLFQNSPSMALFSVSNNINAPYDLNANTAKTLLETERDRLKLQERQDIMAIEVKDMKDQLFHLGITAAETSGKSTSNHENGEILNTTNAGEEFNSAVTLESHNERQDVIERHNLVENKELFSNIQNTIEKPLVDMDPQHSDFKNNITRRAGSVAEKHFALETSNGIQQVLLELDPEHGSRSAIADPFVSSSCIWKSSLDEPARNISENEENSKKVEQMSIPDVYSATLSYGAKVPPRGDILDCVEAGVGRESKDSEGSQLDILIPVSEQFKLSLEHKGYPQKLELEDGSSVTYFSKDVNRDTVDVPDKGPFTSVPSTIKLPHSMEDYKAVLHDLAQSADRALVLFREFQSLQYMSQEACMSDLSGLFQELVPPTHQKVQELSDCFCSIFGGSNEYMNAHESAEISSQRTSSDMLQSSRPSTAVSRAPTESMLESVDIEGFVERYSLRLSETLTSQIVSFLQKKLEP